MKSSQKKVLSALAVVGTIAALAIYLSPKDEMMMSRNLQSSNANANAQVQQLYQNYMSKYNKNYLTKDEYNSRMQIFKSNFEIVSLHNALDQGSKLEMNIFADMSNEEYQKMLGFKPDNTANNESNGRTLQTASYPSSWDWRTQNVLGYVRNQGGCGSCYAFSAVHSIEALIAIRNKTIINLSEQQLVDCSGSYGNYGCSGGFMTACYSYIKSYFLQTEASYPYVATKQTCKYNATNGYTKVRGYYNVASNNPSAHMLAVSQQPLSIGIAASSSIFQLYKSGIISSTGCGTTVNHAVNLVGYGTDSAGVDYWIIRNSWGTYWGESGYARILRTNSTTSSICNMLTMSSYPAM